MMTSWLVPSATCLNSLATSRSPGAGVPAVAPLSPRRARLRRGSVLLTSCCVSRAHSTLAPFIQQGLIVAGAGERPAHHGHDLRAIAVRGHRHLGDRAQLAQQRLSLATGQLLT